MARILPLISTVLAVLVGWGAIGGLGAELLYAGSCCGTGSSAAVADEPTLPAATRRPVRDTPPFRAPHGGQLSKTIWNHYEVVYGLRGTRVYVYDMFRDPASARGIEGQATMRVRSSGQAFSYPLRYVAVKGGQDYLGMSVDLSRVRDADMDLEFELKNLPNRSEPTAQFTQVYASPTSGSQPGVEGAAVAALSAGQEHVHNFTAASSEEHCEPGGASSGGCSCLGCGRGNVDAMAQMSDVHLDQMVAPGASFGAGLRRLPPAGERGVLQGNVLPSQQTLQVVVARATAGDDAAIRSQRICPVMNNPLGSHGPPTKLLVNGRPLFVCCQGCVEKVKKNPEMYLAKVSR